jgi:hypothetical protein
MRGRRRVRRSVDEVVEELEELLRRAYPDSCFPKVGKPGSLGSFSSTSST